MGTVERARLLAAVEDELREVEWAIETLRKGRVERVYITLPGGAVLEVDRETGLEYLERRRSQLLSLAEKLLREGRR